MRRTTALLLAASALLASGCAVNRAASVEPTASAPAPGPTPTVSPRPTASPGFESRGPAEVVHTVDTNDKVVFLTIDDGLDPDPELLRYLQENDIPVTVFLTTGTVTDWQYWRDISSVASIQNHSIVHPSLPGLGEPGEEREICGANDAIAEKTGTTPWMVRPPYGAYDSATLTAAGRCGLDWVVHWSVSLPGPKLEYQTAAGGLKPGDIILTHFRKDLRSQLPAVLEDIKAQGFELGRLEDYLTPRDWPKPPGKDSGMPALDEMQMQTSTESKAYLVTS